MLICFNATTQAKSSLDAILATQQFRDISEAISMALVNYNVLTQTVSQAGQVFPAVAAREGTIAAASEASVPIPFPSESPTVGNKMIVPEVPEAFWLKATTLDGINLLKSTPSASDTTNLPPTQWLFGQFNKFLAPKATCRALLNLLFDNPTGVPLTEAANKISLAACRLGDYLHHLDNLLQSRREDAFSSAFPSSDIEGGGESRLRFGNQFVAHIRHEQLGGFPSALRLVAMDIAKEPRLSLTKVGADFAVLENPVLDGRGAAPTNKLSQAEVQFLLNHILNSIPEETSAYVAILNAVKSGANTPATVDAYLRRLFELPTEEAISDTFLTTQRTGAISRLADLGLIARQKQGPRVTYLVTSSGTEFLSRIKS